MATNPESALELENADIGNASQILVRFYHDLEQGILDLLHIDDDSCLF